MSLLQGIKERFRQADTAGIHHGAGLLHAQEAGKLVLPSPTTKGLAGFAEACGFEHFGQKGGL